MITRKEFNERYAQIESADVSMLRAIIADFHARGIWYHEPKSSASGDPREVARRDNEETLLGMAEALLNLKTKDEQ